MRPCGGGGSTYPEAQLTPVSFMYVFTRFRWKREIKRDKEMDGHNQISAPRSGEAGIKVK